MIQIACVCTQSFCLQFTVPVSYQQSLLLLCYFSNTPKNNLSKLWLCPGVKNFISMKTFVGCQCPPHTECRSWSDCVVCCFAALGEKWMSSPQHTSLVSPIFSSRQLAEAECIDDEVLLQEDLISMQDLVPRCSACCIDNAVCGTGNVVDVVSVTCIFTVSLLLSLDNLQYNGTGNVVDVVSITCIFTVSPFSLQTTCRSWLQWPWGAGRRKTSSPCRTWCVRCSAFCTGSTMALVSWWWRWRRPMWSAWRTVRTSPSCWRPWASSALCSWCRLGTRRRSWWRTAWSERWSLVLPPLHLSLCWVTTVLGPSVLSSLPYSVQHRLCLPSSHSSRFTFSLSLTPNTSSCLQPALSKSVCVCACACACMHVCVCMYVCKFVYVYVCMGCLMMNLFTLISCCF